MKNVNVDSMNKEEVLSMMRFVKDFINTRTAAGILTEAESKEAYELYSRLENRLSEINHPEKQEEQSVKKVSYKEYDKALREAQKNVGDQVDLYEMGVSFERPVCIGVNWSAIGTVTPDEALAFAKDIAKAAKLAQEFPYNGYMIEY